LRNISDVGLGYVSLPLAYEIAKLYSVIGFDINSERLNKLENYSGRTKEFTDEQLRSSKLHYTDRLDATKWLIGGAK